MNWNIKIYKNRYIQYLVWIELFFVCFLGILIDVCNFPRIMRYIPDFINVILIMNLLNKKIRYIKTKGEINIITNYIILFISCSFLLWLFNIGSPLLLLWGARNTFRFLLFYICVIHRFSIDDTEKLLKCINPFLILNFVLCLYEYFVLGYSGDYIGGTFGVSAGCNAPLNVLIVIATIYNAVTFTQRKNNITKVLFYITLCAGISGMAELKVYVVEVIMIVCIIGMFSKGITKKIVLIITGILFAFLSVRFIETLIPGWDGFFTLENMYKMISSTEGYNNTGDLNRMTAISVLKQKIFNDKFNLFGMGLGNCEYSDTFGFLNSEFYKENGYLHYSWFSVAKIYLELGWFGILSHFFVWGYTLFISLKKIKCNKIKIIVTLVSIFSVFFFFYNFTMNLDAAYIIYVFLAMPYIWLNTREKNYNNL